MWIKTLSNVFSHTREDVVMKITRPCTGDAPIGDWTAFASCPELSNRSPVRKTSGYPTVRPSRCAHGSGRDEHATPSRAKQSACTGGAACVTAVSASGTYSNQLRQHCALLKCPVRRGGGACSGLSTRQGPRNSSGYSNTVSYYMRMSLP